MDTNELVLNTLDSIPNPSSDAMKITGLVKTCGIVTGYQLSDNSIVSKSDVVDDD